MANQLEAVCMDRRGMFTGPLEGLPQTIIRNKAGEIVTTSLLEPHRLVSKRMLDAGVKDILKEKLGSAKDGMLDVSAFAAVCFYHDPNSVLHGCWAAEFAGGRYNLARAITSFIEAEDTRRVTYGGSKHDPIEPAKKAGKGNVIYVRVSYTAKRITVYYDMDMELLESYGLGDDAVGLLRTIALWKLSKFLSDRLRVNSMCDFELVSVSGYDIPPVYELEREIQRLADMCRTAGILAKEPTVLVV